MVEKTDMEVQSAYTMARRIAKSVMRTLSTPSMGFDDFVQEGVVAWLEGKSMYYGMIDAFRSQAKLSPYSYTTKGMKEPEVLQFNEEMDGVNEEASEIATKIDAERILKRIQSVQNDQQQFALLGYLYFGMSLREIGTVLEKSHEWVRTYLVEPELKKIREEFKC